MERRVDADVTELLESRNILAEYNDALLAGGVDDPYPRFRELRYQGAVYDGDLVVDVMGMPASAANIARDPDRPVFSLLSYDEVLHAFRDHRTFSSEVMRETLGRSYGMNLIMFDPPEHNRFRAVLQPVFTKRAVEAWRPTIEQIANEYVDEFIDRGRSDIVGEFAWGYPVKVVQTLLGIPDEDFETFWQLGVGLLAVRSDPELALTCKGHLEVMYERVLDERRSHPRDDLISLLLAAQAESDDPLSDDEVMAFLNILLPSGGETTTRLIGNLFAALCQNPEQFDAVRAERALVPAAIEETLRWEPSAVVDYRITKQPVEVAGVEIPERAGIILCIGSANRDESRWGPDAEQFDLRRTAPEGVTHLAFAQGAHYCLGLHLARLEADVAVRVLLDRLPGLRPDPHAPVPEVRGSTFRWPREVNLVWE